ncbi:SdpI family protein [Ignavibacterium album]|uniref:SdpI family protein n=1 Tax=Ignavibacterium album TaxID=591197 RepID=UPI001439E5E8|nr:SdpI family protein [Ignavibacterium album]
MIELLENVGFIILGLCGLIFLIAGLIQIKFPPKKINSLYGYRTSSSMQSEAAWNFAQIYSAKLSIKVGIIMIAFAFASLLFHVFSNDNQVWISLIIIFTLTGILIFSTEKKLKEKFGKK